MDKYSETLMLIAEYLIYIGWVNPIVTNERGCHEAKQFVGFIKVAGNKQSAKRTLLVEQTPSFDGNTMETFSVCVVQWLLRAMIWVY